MDKKWYQNNFVIITLLILFFPVGLFLMWKYANWNKPVKWVVTGVFALFLIGSVASGNSTESNPSSSSTNSQVETQSPTESPTNTPVPAERVKVEVASQIVKKVDGKYRYFFDIRNNNTKDFEGDVTISLFNNKQKSDRKSVV